MIKYLITGALALLVCGTLPAKTLTPEEALQRVQSKHAGMRAVNGKFTNTPELILTAVTAKGEPAVYLFGSGDAGCMVLSADDIAYPVLGYTDNGSVDTENMPEAMKWWLDEYARQIEYARANTPVFTGNHRPVVAGAAIAPMITTHWDQGEPYNRFSPVVNGSRAYTGCVATAMAQIMYYWKYPAVGTGKINYNDEEGCGKRLTWDFTMHSFEWDKMLTSYDGGDYTDEAADAVAVLMRSAGASVKMSYGYDSSGALSLNTQLGFTKYLGYDGNIKHMLRSTVAASEWERMIYDNLKNVGPVLYGGGSMLGGGHSFIVDGYDGDGYFHFNWGWSEMSDGYFLLDALNPSSLGAGGGSGGGYNFTQDAVFGIQPPTGNQVEEKPLKIFQMGSLKGTVTGSELSLELIDEGEPMWVNYNPTTVKIKFGAIVSRVGDDGENTCAHVCLSDENYTLQPGYGANVKGISPKVDMDTVLTDDGVYKFTTATLNVENQSATWEPMTHNYGCANYVIVRKSGNTYTVDENITPKYTINSVEIEGDIYYGCAVKVKFSVTNNNDIEISRGIAPMLFTSQGSLAFMGDGKFLTIQPHETLEGTFITDMYPMSNSVGTITTDTQFYLTVFEESSYSIMAKEFLEPVVMHANPGRPDVAVSPALEIEGAEWRIDRTGGSMEVYYEVTNPADIHLTAGLRLKRGIVAYPIYVCLLEAVDGSGNFAVLDYQGDYVFMSRPGEEFDLDVNFNFRNYKRGVAYYFQIAYGVNQSFLPLDNNILKFKVTGDAGVTDAVTEESKIEFDGSVITSSQGHIEVYNLHGVRIAEGTGRVDTSGLTAGVYIARSGDHTMKIVVK